MFTVDNTEIKYYSDTIWHAGNDGAGSGLDADLLDGVQGSSFARSDVDDDFTGTTYKFLTNNVNVVLGASATSGDRLRLHRNTTSTYIDYGTGSLFFRANGSGNGVELTSGNVVKFLNTPTVGSNTIWHAGNDGAGSGLDADLFDGLNSSAFLRSDVADTFTGSTLSVASGSSLDVDGSVFRAFNNTDDPDIGGLVHGTTSGGLIETPVNAHTVIGLRENGASDSFYVLSGGGNWDIDSTYDTVAFRVQASGTVTVGSDLVVSGSSATVNGNQILTTADEGTLDAGTLDGLDSSQFVRSDANDTLSGDYTFYPASTAGVTIQGTDPYTSGRAWLTVDAPSAGGNYDDQTAGITVGETASAALHMVYTGDGYAHIGMGTVTDGATDPIQHRYLRFQYTGNQAVADQLWKFTEQVSFDVVPLVGGNTVWHAGNDGSASGLDADLLDGVQGASYLRSDVDDTFTGNLTISGTISSDASAGYDKIRVWNSNLYTIGMNSAMTFGHLSDYAMTFTMSNTANRGFIWRDFDDAKSDGAMSLTTDGRLHIKTSASIGSTSNVVWHSGNDGSGSGLDADLLDGVHGSSFFRADADDTVTSIPTFTGTRLQVDSGTPIVMGNDPYYAFNVASAEIGGSNHVGAIVLHWNRNGENQMAKVRVHGYLYDDTYGTTLDVTVGGYARADGVSFVNFHHYISSGSRHPKTRGDGGADVTAVRWAQETANGNIALIIGDVTSVWDYPKLFAEAFLSHSATVDDLDGWSITIETSLVGYDTIATPTESYGIITDSGNVNLSIDGVLVSKANHTHTGTSDGSPPSSSPTPSLAGGPGYLIASWDAVTNDDIVVYEVHISTSSSFTPAAGTLVGRTAATNFVTEHADSVGNPLVYGVTYYCKLIATDIDGAAAAGSVSNGSTMVKIDTEDLGDNIITAAKIVAGTITANEIAANTITAANIAAGTITAGQIAAGTITASEIAANTITAAEIAANAITTDELSANSVTAAKIAANTITAAEIAASTITSTQIAADTITAGNIAANAVTASEIAANAVTAAKINANAVTTDKLNALAVTAAKIAANTITAAQIAAATITSAEIAADTITAGNIAANAITTSELNAGSVTTAKLAAGAVTANEIAANTITASQIAASTITATEIASNAITAVKINANAVTTAKLDANAVTAAKLSAMNIEAGKYIRSTTYTAGTTGWSIDAGGDAEFNNVTVRGTVDSSTITGSTITGGEFETATSGLRIEINSTAATNEIRFFTGNGGETAHGFIKHTLEFETPPSTNPYNRVRIQPAEFTSSAPYIEINGRWNTGTSSIYSDADAYTFGNQTTTFGYMRGTWEFPNQITIGGFEDTGDDAVLRIENTQDLSLSSTNHPFQVGYSTGQNVAIDNNEIMARNNGAASLLNLNVEGGGVRLDNGRVAVWTGGSDYASFGHNSKGPSHSTQYGLIQHGTNGNVFISGGGVWLRRENSSTAQVRVVDLGGNSLFEVDTVYASFLSIRSSTTAGSAAHWRSNAGVTNELFKYTSSIKFKDDIKDASFDTSKIFDLRLRDWTSKITWDTDNGMDDPSKRIMGLVAEEVAGVSPEFAVSNDLTGEVENINDRSILLSMLAEIQKLRNEVNELQGKKPHRKAPVNLVDKVPLSEGAEYLNALIALKSDEQKKFEEDLRILYEAQAADPTPRTEIPEELKFENRDPDWKKGKL